MLPQQICFEEDAAVVVPLVQTPLLIGGGAEDAKLTRGCNGLCQTTKDGGQFAKAELCQYN